MLEKPHVKTEKVQRAYLTLDKSPKSCIMEYTRSSTEPKYIMEKLVWNTWDTTPLENNLRDGKFLIAIV